MVPVHGPPLKSSGMLSIQCDILLFLLPTEKDITSAEQLLVSSRILGLPYELMDFGQGDIFLMEVHPVSLAISSPS